MNYLLNYTAIDDDPVHIFQTSRFFYLNTKTGQVEKDTDTALPCSVISATISGVRYSCKLDYSNGSMSVHPIPHEKEKIRFAFMGPESVWGASINTEPSIEVPILTSSVPNIRGRYRNLKQQSKVQYTLNHPLIYI